MLRWLMMGAALLCGCVSKPTPDSSGASHWLLPCAVDAECGGALACLCGQCSAGCDADPNVCLSGECVADACGGEAICRALVADGEDPEHGEAALVNGPTIDAGNPRGVWQFHRPSVVEGNVLELRADGTFIYTLGGCDAVECAWGRWQSAAGGLRLTPPPGEDGFRWPDEFALETVSAVWLSLTADGMTAAVSAPDREDYEQAWLRQNLTLDCIDWSVHLSDDPAEPQHCESPAFPE